MQCNIIAGIYLSILEPFKVVHRSFMKIRRYKCINMHNLYDLTPSLEIIHARYSSWGTHCWSMLLNIIFLCVSMTAFRSPVVPLENRRKATSSGWFLTGTYVLVDWTSSEKFMEVARIVSVTFPQSKTMNLHVEQTSSIFTQCSAGPKIIWGFAITWRWVNSSENVKDLSLIHIWRCRRSTLCRSRWSPYH